MRKRVGRKEKREGIMVLVTYLAYIHLRSWHTLDCCMGLHPSDKQFLVDKAVFKPQIDRQMHMNNI